MDQLKNYYKEMGVDEKVFDYAQEVEKGLKDRFESYHGVRILDEARTVKPDQGIKCDAETSDCGNASGWHNRIWIQ